MGVGAQSKITPLELWWDLAQTNLNIYLVRGELTGLIDTAAPSCGLREVLANSQVPLNAIGLILNTHGHSDHTGGNALVKGESNARIFIHQDDAVFLEDHGKCFDEFFGPMSAALRGEEAARKERDAFIEANGPDLPVDRILNDNDVVDFGKGLALRVIHIPGHTSGSVGFLLEEEGILITGDATPGLGNPGGALPIILDVVSYQKSIGRLLELPIKTLYTTHPFRGLHSPPATVHTGNDVRPFLMDCRELAGKLAEALYQQAGSGLDRTLAQMVDSVVESLPAEMGFKKTADLFMPEFSLATVFWSLRNLAASQ